MFMHLNNFSCKITLAATLALVMSACSTYRPDSPDIIQDSAPGHEVDISQIGDAVPKNEPLSRYGNPKSYVVFGERYHLLDKRKGYKQRGVASWYGTKFHGRRTSSGEPYDMFAMTAAHKTLPIPTYARVTNLDNGKSIIVKINDRGPFVGGRLIDLSYVAARKLDITAKGTGRVEIQTIVPGTGTTAAKTETAVAAQRTIPTQSTEAITYASPRTNNLYLQVGIFRDRVNAEQLRQDLARLSPDIHIAADKSTAQTLYRVRIGPLAKDDEADQLIESLAQLGHKGFRIRVD